MGWDWKESPWLSYKDWSLKSLLRDATGIFKCPAEIPPVLALYPDTETPEKRVPVCLDAGKNASDEFALKVMAQLEAGALAIGAIFGPNAKGAAPTEAPVYVAGLDTNATPKVMPIRVSDGTGIVHCILTAGAAAIGKLAANAGVHIGDVLLDAEIPAGTQKIGKILRPAGYDCAQVSAGAHGAGAHTLAVGTVGANKQWRLTGFCGYMPTTAGTYGYITVSSGANSFSTPRVTLTNTAQHYDMMPTISEILVHTGDTVTLSVAGSAEDEAVTGCITYEEEDTS